MKILQCHNLYQVPGGEDAVVNDERALLEAHGHHVVQYLRHNDEVNELGKLRVVAGTVWSRASVRAIDDLIQAEQPDLVHIHNTMPLISPAVYRAIQKRGVPVVQTLHNYRLLCPKGTFYRDGAICEKCLNKSVKWPAVMHACYRDSRAGSAVLTVMGTTHKALGTYTKHIDAFIATSNFARSKVVAGGYPGERIHVKPNFEMHDPAPGSSGSGGGGGYALYLGRLSPEKGIETLVAAWDRPGNTVPLKVAGTGPEEDAVGALASRRANVEALGFQSGDALEEVLAGAEVLVMPSINYEGFPKAVAEGYARGLPVLASELGTLAEVIEEGVTGRRVPHADPAALADAAKAMLADRDQLAAMRRNARRAYETKYNAEANYERLMEVYQIAIEHHAQRK